MTQGHSSVQLLSPEQLVPDSSAKLVIKYVNKNKDLNHHIKSVSFSPTWDLTEDKTYEVDLTVPGGKGTQLLDEIINIPPSIGGHQGFLIKINRGISDKSGNINYSNCQTGAPIRVPVTGASRHQTVLCHAGTSEYTSSVQNLIQNWGFNVSAANREELVINQLESTDDKPVCVFGILSSNVDGDRDLVSSAASIAASRNSLSMVFATKSVELPRLPDECIVVKCDLSDEVTLEQEAGPLLLGIRRLVQSGRVSTFLDKLNEVAKNEPKELLRASVYAAVLEKAGATDAISGINDSLMKIFGRSAELPTQGSWPMFGGGCARTGHSAKQNGPMDSPIELWKVSLGSEVECPPAVVNNKVYLGCSDHSIYALDAETGDICWSFETSDRVYSGPAVVGRTVYFGSNDKSVYALDSETGRRRWSYKTDDGVISSPAVVDDTVYIGSKDNSIYALDARTGRKQWSYKTGNPVRSSPAVVNGTVYIGSEDYGVYALDAKTGDKLWRYETGGFVCSTPAVADGTVYIGSVDQSVYALDAQTGKKRWSYQTGGWVDSSPSVAKGIVYVGSMDQSVYALDARTGQKYWSFETNGNVYTKTAVVGEIVYIGSGSIYAVDAKTGNERWSFETVRRVHSPTVINGAIFIGSKDENHSVYVLTKS